MFILQLTIFALVWLVLVYQDQHIKKAKAEARRYKSKLGIAQSKLELLEHAMKEKQSNIIVDLIEHAIKVTDGEIVE